MNKTAIAQKLQDVHHYFGSILHFHADRLGCDSTFDCRSLVKALDAYKTGKEYLRDCLDAGIDLGMVQTQARWTEYTEELIDHDDIVSVAELVTMSKKAFDMCNSWAEFNGIDAHTGRVES